MMRMTDAMREPPVIRADSHPIDQRVLSDDLPPLEMVREMIRYETKLRLSEPIQELFDLHHKDDQAITYVSTNTFDGVRENGHDSVEFFQNYP